MDGKQAWALFGAMMLYDGGPPVTSASDTAILDHVHMGEGAQADFLRTQLLPCTAGVK